MDIKKKKVGLTVSVLCVAHHRYSRTLVGFFLDSSTCWIGVCERNPCDLVIQLKRISEWEEKQKWGNQANDCRVGTLVLCILSHLISPIQDRAGAEQPATAAGVLSAPPLPQCTETFFFAERTNDRPGDGQSG